MVDIEIVKENYRRMSDDQLVRFAKLEAENLSLEAFHALKNELDTRNIDLNIIEELEDVDVPERVANNAVTNFFVDKLFEFVLEEKVKGISNAEVYQGLMAKKIQPEQAVMILEMFEDVCIKAIKNMETQILISWVLFFVGILLCLFFYNPLGIKFFIGIFVVLAASVKLADLYGYKKKITLALQMFKEEKETGVKNLYQ